ncbi:MAG TPA: carboxypeptidase-like regulatory domain-containing protein [Pyrinomonadaceae bacterium]|nr:carboxypeptidase-like regulatory domain-containing protein [Pyrinomonadaceae bacterium]
MIPNRLIFAALVLALCVIAQAQVPTNKLKTTEQPTTGTIDGKVVNESGQPMAGAMVFARTVNAGFNRITITDLDGNFRINGLETGLYVVGANAPAYTSAPGDPDAQNYYRLGDSARVEIVRGGAITGTVTNSIGEPVIAVRVRAMLIRDVKGQTPRTPTIAAFEQPTDDRGIYRIYGLPPGTYLVSAGGASYVFNNNPFESDIPTFAPSSTRDNAAEIMVRSGEEVAADIRYRGEPGHSISGTVKIVGTNSATLFLTRPGSNIPVATSIQIPGMRGFILSGLGDGDYDLVAQESIANPGATLVTLALSEPKRITVKGADVTGIEVVTKRLGSISGKILLEPTKAPECEGKRPPVLAETLVRFRRPDKESDKDPLAMRLLSGSASPDTAGAFSLRNLLPGKYQFEPRFYARYWYLQSITMQSAGPKPTRIDAAANWTTLKSGEQLSNLTITLAEGAASIRGTVPPSTDSTLPPAVIVYLIPNDRDKVEDVLRFFVTDVASDGTFTFNSVPPGKYLVLTQTAVDPQIANTAKLRQPDAVAARTKLRRTAETKKSEIELKPCQNLADYQLKP